MIIVKDKKWKVGLFVIVAEKPRKQPVWGYYNWEIHKKSLAGLPFFFFFLSCISNGEWQLGFLVSWYNVPDLVYYCQFTLILRIWQKFQNKKNIYIMYSHALEPKGLTTTINSFCFLLYYCLIFLIKNMFMYVMGIYIILPMIYHSMIYIYDYI